MSTLAICHRDVICRSWLLLFDKLVRRNERAADSLLVSCRREKCPPSAYEESWGMFVPIRLIEMLKMLGGVPTVNLN